MKLRPSSWLLLPALLVTVSACLPSRDNRFDPANAPAAHLAVEDGGAPGACLAASSSLLLAPVGSLAHGRCLVLDARATVFLTGTAGGVTYQFFALGTAGVPVSLAARGADPVLVLTSSTVRSFSIGPAFFRVTVDAGGHVGTGDASVELVDTAPVARADPPRTLPLGGFGWAPGQPFQITFDGSRSFDPDGDALQFCWTRPDGVVLPCSSSPSFVFQASATTATNLAATLTVRDPYQQASTASDTVAIGQVQAFGFAVDLTTFIPAQTDEIDEGYREFIYPGEVFPAPNVNATEAIAQTFVIEPTANQVDAQLLALDLNQKAVSLYSEQGFTLLSTVPVTISQNGTATLLGPVAITVDPSNGNIWAITDVGGQGPAQRGLQRLSISGTTLAPDGPMLTVAASTSESAVFSSNSYLQARLATDAAGNVYYAGALDGRLVEAVSPSGQPVGQWSTDPGDEVSGLARAANGEVWMMEGEGFVGNTPGAPAIVRLLPGGQSVRYPITGSPFTSGMAWINGGRFWTWIDSTISLIDSQRLLDTGDVASAVDVSFPGIQTAFVNADPVSGLAWWQDFTLDTLIQVSPDGSISTQATNLLPQEVDSWGTVVSVFPFSGEANGSGPIIEGKGADSNAIRASFDLVGLGTPDLSGGIWVALTFQRELDHLGSDGTVLQRVTTMTGPTGPPQALPITREILQAPDGSLWGRVIIENETGSVHGGFLHLRPGPAPSSDATLLSSFPTNEVEGAIEAIRFGAAGVWIEDVNGSNAITYQVWNDSGPEVASLFTTPAGENQNNTVESDLSGNLCLATLAAGNVVNLRFLTRSGTQTLLTQIASIGESRAVMAAEQGTIAGAEVCWVAWFDEPANPPVTGTLNVQAWSVASPALMASFSESAAIPAAPSISLWATDPQDLWLIYGGEEASPWTLQDVQFGAGGGAGTLAPAFPTVPVGQFLPH